MKFAYIFDFDGVLVRTMEAHFRCYQRALEEVGVPIDRGQFYRQAGMTGQEQIRYFAQRAQVSVDVEAVYRRKRAIWEAGTRWSRSSTATSPCCGASRRRRAGRHRQRQLRGSVLPVMQQHGLEVDAVVGARTLPAVNPRPTSSSAPPSGWARRRPTVSSSRTRTSALKRPGRRR